MGPSFGVNERGVASSVRSLNLDVGFDHLNANIGRRSRCYGGGNARTHRRVAKLRRVMSPGCESFVVGFFLSSVMAFVQKV